MPDPFEIVDDLTSSLLGPLPLPPVSPPGIVQVLTVRKPPYLAGTVSVYRNGMLQHPDFFAELDATQGTVGLCEEILIREDEDDHSVSVVYLTFQEPFVDPERPVHISKVVPGDVLRIAMKAGRHLEPVVRRKTKQMELHPGRQVSGKSLRAKAFSRTVFLGRVTQNDLQGGQLTLETQHRSNWSRNVVTAFVPFRDIQVVRKYITPGPAGVDSRIPISAARNARRRPGIIAKGLFDARGFMKLVRVFF